MAKDMTLLWGSGSPPCWRVMIALEEKNLQGYNQKLLSFQKGEHKSKEVTDINPRGQLPAFKHGNVVVNESYAACMYLESQFKQQGTKLIPDNPGDLALMLQRFNEVPSLHDKIVCIVLFNFRVPEEERHESTLKRYKENLSTEVKLWEGYLQKSTSGFIAGKEFSMADVVVFPTVAFLIRLGLLPERYPKITAYYNKLKDRPSIKASWPPHWLESPNQELLKEI